MDLDALEQIEKLNSLKEKGLLTDKEFETAKKEILNKNQQPMASTAPATPQFIIQNSTNSSAVAVSGGNSEKKRYSVFIAFFLCLFGGWAGLHRFYTGYYFSGIVYLLTGGFFLIGWAWDLISIFFGFYRDPEGRTLG